RGEKFENRNDRKFDRGERRERKFDRDRQSGYRDRNDDRAPSTENMSMEEKLAALASRFNRK
ncbi:MAG: hypothetical protein K2L88_04160, partial [Clostridiales bacterium]|nr:hypothetical protein [Clostridiales bacterium]